MQPHPEIYKAITRPIKAADLAQSGLAIEEVLNQLAQDGWEFHSVTPEPLSGQLIYVFKQPVKRKTFPDISPADRIVGIPRPSVR